MLGFTEKALEIRPMIGSILYTCALFCASKVAVWDPHSVFEKEYLDDVYSYQNPEAHIQFFQDGQISETDLILLKKTNSEYFLLPTGEYSIKLPKPIELISRDDKNFVLYKIDDVLLPDASSIQMQPLSIITAPIGSDPTRFWHHQAVYDSIVNGLSLIEAKFNCDPKSKRKLNPHVLVLANNEPVSQMLKFREEKRIQKMFMGPNFVFDSTTMNIQRMDFCDKWIVPSLWTKKEIGEMHPSMAEKISIWKVGVNTEYWNPNNREKKRIAILYDKYDSKTLTHSIDELLKFYGWEVKLIKYGEYTQSNYKSALEDASIAIFISPSESQGIALAEAWSMNVPTFVWDNRGVFTFNHFYKSNSAPYLNPNVGRRWKNLSELENLLASVDEILPQVAPRKWVLRNMSDEISALDLLMLFRLLPQN